MGQHLFSLEKEGIDQIEKFIALSVKKYFAMLHTIYRRIVRIFFFFCLYDSILPIARLAVPDGAVKLWVIMVRPTQSN